MESGVRGRGSAGHRFHTLSIFSCVIIGILGGAVQSLCQNPEAEGRLRERIGAFWTAMEKADFAAAAEYIHPDSRGIFRDRMSKSRTGKWRIDKLEFNKDFTECKTVTAVRRELPFMGGGDIEWPMHNIWVLDQGEWFLKVPWDKDENPLLKMFREQEQVAAKGPARTAASQPAAKPAPENVGGYANRIHEDANNPKVLHFGEKGVFRFNYRNDTKGPIRIVSALADCHCTGVSREGYPEVAPGETGSIEITLDTFGLPIGPVNKDVRVLFSDLQAPMVIHLGVSNLPNFIVSPARAEFAALRIGIAADRTIRIKNDSGRTVTVIGVMNADPLLKVSLEKKTAAPSEDIVLSLRYEPKATGDIMDAISLRTDLAAEPLVNIPVRGKVGP